MTAVLLLVAAMAALSITHELGHAAAARALGLHVTDICFGLGPALRFRRRGITWMIAPIPLGGFVRVSELTPPETTSPPRGADAWLSCGAIAKRLAVIGAGPAANYLLATALALVLGLALGLETGRTAGLRVVRADAMAEKAGLASGDVVARVNGREVVDLGSLSSALAQAGSGGMSVVTVRRHGLPVELRMFRARARDGAAWGLGAAYVLEPDVRQVGLLDGFVHAVAAPIREAKRMLGHSAGILLPRRTMGARPVGIVGLIDQVHSTRSWTGRRVLSLGMSLSVAMGLFNLLPFPGLDGGRLLIEALQAARRRQFPARSLVAVQIGGGLVLLTLWILLTAFEIVRW